MTNDPDHHLWINKKKRQQATNKIPQTTQDHYIKLLQEGKTIGEARTTCNLPLPIACQILDNNIETIHVLRTKE